MKSTIQLQVGDFEVAASFYQQTAVIIIHQSIPGVGHILYTEKSGGNIEVDQLLGQENEFLTLFVTEIARQFSTPNITFILSFHPSKMSSFENIRDFSQKFSEIQKTSQQQPQAQQ